MNLYGFQLKAVEFSYVIGLRQRIQTNNTNQVKLKQE